MILISHLIGCWCNLTCFLSINGLVHCAFPKVITTYVLLIGTNYMNVRFILWPVSIKLIFVLVLQYFDK